MKFVNLKFIAIMIFIIAAEVTAQGTVKGVVVDSLTSQTLVGANVFVVGTSLGSATDIEGEYKITRIPAGPFKLKVSYIGYESKEFDLSIQDNKTLEFFVELAPQAIEGITVVVTAQAKGQVAAINQQLTANTIVNVISEEKIQELPDANAAEAIGRLPGVSISRSGGEANKITLRGLSDKYSYVTIDGVKIPSTDAAERGVDLSTFSQNNLAGIELFKALTSDKEADAIAGSVNLVTKKAPVGRTMRAIVKGGYNQMIKSAQQYDLSFRYTERYFDNILGMQVSGNLEQKIRSRDSYNISYDQTIENQTSYFINNFTLNFTDEERTRNGANLILDIDTPDKGNIKLNSSYSSTKRDYLIHTRDYPLGGGGNSQTGSVTYSYRDIEREINTFSSALTGDNTLIGLDFTWGASFAQSTSDNPYDYQMNFTEPSISGSAGMKAGIPEYKENPENLIPFAYNNFRASTLSEAFYNTQHNLDKDLGAFIDIKRNYNFGSSFSGEVKWGGMYKRKVRTNANSLLYSPYYLGTWKPFEKLPDGTIRAKNFSGTYFDGFYQRYLENPSNLGLPFSEVLDNDPQARNLYDKYDLRPLINRDKLRQWYELNQYGINQAGNSVEYSIDPSVKAFSYDISESVTSAYLMNTLNIGQNLVFLAGIRVEKESNVYNNQYSPIQTGGFPIPPDASRDTSGTYSETIWLPNFQLNFKATDFLNIRLAAYKALARPDFNMRLNTYFAWRPAASSGNRQLIVGNNKLKTAKAWNFEINTSFYGNKIGLFSISAFYKEIEDMYHMLNQINTSGNVLLEKLGLDWKTLHQSSYQLTVPYNSPDPSKVWGFELEHQVNLTFLPGLLKNLILSYNASLVKSETTIYGTVIDTTYKEVDLGGGIIIRTPEYNERVVQRRQQLEDQPELYGNISLGYDIGNFSGRISLFHQSEYNLSFSPSGRGDRIIDAYTRFDLALRYRLFDYLSLLLNVNNITNIDEDNYLNNRVNGYKILRSSERYGTTMDFGVRVDL